MPMDIRENGDTLQFTFDKTDYTLTVDDTDYTPETGCASFSVAEGSLPTHSNEVSAFAEKLQTDVLKEFAVPSKRENNYTEECKSCPKNQWLQPEGIQDGTCHLCPAGFETTGSGVGEESCTVHAALHSMIAERDERLTNRYQSNAQWLLSNNANCGNNLHCMHAAALAQKLNLKLGCGVYDFAGADGYDNGLYAYKAGTYKDCAFFGTRGRHAGLDIYPLNYPKYRPGLPEVEDANGRDVPQHPTTEADAVALAEALGFTRGTARWAFAGDYGCKGFYSYRSDSRYRGYAFFGTGGSVTEMQAPCGGDKYRPTAYDRSLNPWGLSSVYGLLPGSFAEANGGTAAIIDAMKTRALQTETQQPGTKPSSDAQNDREKADDKKVDDKQSSMKRSAGDEEESKIHSIVKRFKFNVEQMKP